MNELEIIEKIRRMAERGGRVPGKAEARGRLILGIGDDCAILRPAPGEDLLFKADQVIEDVHFRRDQDAALIGQRALGRALSDIAAMGGKPLLCLVALCVPRELGERWITAFYGGLMRLARATGTELAGGDLAHADKIYCDVSLCGSAPKGKALRRDGAKPGDAIYVSGTLGKPWDGPIVPRLELGQWLAGKASACMDISDGLALDLHRLCLASKVAAEIDGVPMAKGATMERALHGGEDYELLFTMPERVPVPRERGRVPLMRIGTILKAGRTKSDRPGAILYEGKPLPARGYDHFGKLQ